MKETVILVPRRARESAERIVWAGAVFVLACLVAAILQLGGK